jgi:hypothetical protein
LTKESSHPLIFNDFLSLSLSIVFRQTHSERAPEDEWLDILPHPVFSSDGDSFMLLAGIQETGTEHFTHIKHVTITQQRISVISHGRYEVIVSSPFPSSSIIYGSRFLLHISFFISSIGLNFSLSLAKAYCCFI